ncbi:MAG: HNH endonuclease, partial [Planctomycetaceae bacterium]|nr:HNH endonuclease [Planctomycetaceae bacterium]
NQNIIRELDETGLVEAEYTLNPQPYGDLVSQHQEAESTFYHFDALGSTRVLTDGNAVETDTYVYAAFGKLESSTGSTPNKFTYVGELGYYFDEETGDYYLRRRQYGPDQNRFRSEDPILFASGTTGLYEYAGNNPVNAVDPSGLEQQAVTATRGGGFSLSGAIQAWVSSAFNNPSAEAIQVGWLQDAQADLRNHQIQLLRALNELGEVVAKTDPEHVEELLDTPGSELNQATDRVLSAYDAYVKAIERANQAITRYLEHATLVSPRASAIIQQMYAAPLLFNNLQPAEGQLEGVIATGLESAEAFREADKCAARAEGQVQAVKTTADAAVLVLSVVTLTAGAHQAAKEGGKAALKAYATRVAAGAATNYVKLTIATGITEKLLGELGLSEESILLATLAITAILERRRAKAKTPKTPDECPVQNAPGKDTIQKVGGRNPVNSKYAGKTYPVEKLPADLQAKYPNSVRFTTEGFPDFSPYAKARVKLNGLTGNYPKDAALANKAVGLSKTPDNFVWHHVEDGKTMLLVPKDIHNTVRHTGGSAVIRHGAF